MKPRPKAKGKGGRSTRDSKSRRNRKRFRPDEHSRSAAAWREIQRRKAGEDE